LRDIAELKQQAQDAVRARISGIVFPQPHQTYERFKASVGKNLLEAGAAEGQQDYLLADVILDVVDRDKAMHPEWSSRYAAELALAAE
jgi:hypothetical protein